MDFSTDMLGSMLEIYDQSPNIVWWKDLEHRYRLINRAGAVSLGFKSSKISYESPTDYDIPNHLREHADQFVELDNYVLKTGIPISILCFGKYSDGQWRMHICNVHTILNNNNCIMGLAGNSIEITDTPLMRSALFLIEGGMIFNQDINHPHFNLILQNAYDDFKLSSRESECLFFYIRGYTAKEVALKMGIKYKTIQNYLERIKIKMGCSSRSQIVEKALHRGMGKILPKQLLLSSSDRMRE
ncbi:MAG: helix-turn-helix transcriptional regulator [Gammaproteobacteria bacterium]|nr:helix-turn-helix transcriptional regulator [Gammaproteobacteria bacterium]